MEILECDQVKMSKQLRYMKELGMVEGEREAQWMVYRLADPGNPVLTGNLKCLQDCAGEELSFREDWRKRQAIIRRLQSERSGCSGVLLGQQRKGILKEARR